MRRLFPILFAFCFFPAENAMAGSESWIKKTGMPADGRHRPGFFQIGLKGYMGMGHINSGPAGEIYYDDWWEYDPASDSWTQVADYGGSAGCGPVSFVIDGIAYVGSHEVNPFEWHKFNPVTNSWSAMVPMPSGASDMIAFSIGGYGYYMDGNSNLQRYDPAGDFWSYISTPPSWVYSSSTVFVINDRAYITTYGPVTLRYDPAGGTWFWQPPFPGIADFGYNSFVVHNKGYLLGGYVWGASSYESSGEVWQYDPTTSFWTQLPDFPGLERRVGGAWAINDIGYYGLGTDGTNFNDLWAFDVLLSNDEQPASISDEPYPNPSNDRMTFNFTNLGSFHEPSLRIYSLDGKQVYARHNIAAQLQVNRSDLGSGTYLYQISSDSEILQTGKLIFTD
jgi:N-acetylneuraminic acid mutarotase